jgi:hypothetical protein
MNSMFLLGKPRYSVYIRFSYILTPFDKIGEFERDLIVFDIAFIAG